MRATIRFQSEAALLADYIVEVFRIPVPRNEHIYHFYILISARIYLTVRCSGRP